MSQFKYAEIADTVYFWFAVNDVTGTAADGATPLYAVRLAGAAAGAAPTATGTPTLLSHASYCNGLYEIALDTTGWAAGEYAVFCSITVSTVNPAGFVGSFKLRTAGTSALKVEPVGAITLSSLTISGNASVGGTTTLTGAVSTGAVTLSALTVTNNLLVSGTTTLTGNVTLSGTLGVGATTLSALTVTNNLLVSGTTTHTGNVTLSGTLTTGAATLASVTSTGAFSISGVSNISQIGNSYAIVNHVDYGNAKLVRSTTPANTLTVDSNHLVAIPDTQKVDVNTVKTRAVTDVGGGNTVYLGTAAWSTLTQTNITGGAYDVTNSSCLIHLASGQSVTLADGAHGGASTVITLKTPISADANISSINGVTLKGNGSTTPWGPA